MDEARRSAWIESAAARYAGEGRFARGFARGKLSRDPVYAFAVESGALPSHGVLLDLGCGRGLLLSALREAGSALRLIGIESAKTAEVAARALDGEAEIVRGDVREARLPTCDAAALLDVLHYLERDDQEDLLRAVASALRAGGVLLVREADASAGRGFAAVRLAERLASCARGEPFRKLVYRGAAEWERVLGATGLAVESMPMGSGTPFANVLLVGRKR